MILLEGLSEHPDAGDTNALWLQGQIDAHALNQIKGAHLVAPAGKFPLSAGINLHTNIWLSGAGWSNLSAYSGVGTTFYASPEAVIPKLFYADMRLEERNSSNVSLSHMAISGNANYDAQVGVLVHLVGVAHSVNYCQIGQGSGDGVIIGDRTCNPWADGFYWVFWLTHNRIQDCSGYGLSIESSDGFVDHNYIGSNGKGSISYGGGNLISNNHFDNSWNPNHAALALQEHAWTAEPHFAEFLDNNYFDVNATALLLAGSGAAATQFLGSISNQHFRANDRDIVINGSRDVIIRGGDSRGGGFSNELIPVSISGANSINTRISGMDWMNWPPESIVSDLFLPYVTID